MTLRRRIARLRREAEEEAVLIKLRDGTTRTFSDMECFAEMFLAQMDLFGGESYSSEVLDAVRAATPESRASFEAEYGSIEMEALIVAGAHEGSWVEVHKLLEDGTVQSVRHEGGTEEAKRLHEEAKQQGPKP